MFILVLSRLTFPELGSIRKLPAACTVVKLTYRYNITGLEDNEMTIEGNETTIDEEVDDEIDIEKKRPGGHRHGRKKDDCSRPENEDKPHCSFKHKPRYYSKHSPSRSNKPLTPLGYAQFYLPDIDKQTDSAPGWILEYTTFKLKNLLPGWMFNTTDQHTQPLPVPLHLLPNYDASLSSNAEQGLKGKDKEKDKLEEFVKSLKPYTPWKMRDLTIPSYVHLARKLVAEKKMWKKFTDYM
jgi:endopolyphosphatase